MDHLFIAAMVGFAINIVTQTNHGAYFFMAYPFIVLAIKLTRKKLA